MKAKVAELELLVKEQEMEVEEEDSIYKSLYDEFITPKKDIIKELCKDYKEEDNDLKVLNEYL